MMSSIVHRTRSTHVHRSITGRLAGSAPLIVTSVAVLSSSDAINGAYVAVAFTTTIESPDRASATAR
jgi:hypothetical protein